MADIDSLFKKPGLPSIKRKLEAHRNPNEIYKSAKLTPNGDVKGKVHIAPVEDGDEDDEVAGPGLPPDDDQGPEPEDEEGRFFGSGVTRNTADVLDFIEERDKEDFTTEKIDSSWLRKLALNFEKRISKNAELRAKFEDDPPKFMGSEADLDADVKGLSILSDHPELYEEFAKLGCVGSLVSLLAHENTDIAIDSIEIINELTDEDVQAGQKAWDALVDALLEADLPNLLVQNLHRLDEGNESDVSGVYHSLSIIENLASNASVAERLVRDSPLLKWLLRRIQRTESPVSQNKQYAAEILAILQQSSLENRNSFAGLDGVEVMLQLLSAYRKRDPAKDSEEEEFVENLFDCLTAAVENEAGKSKFIEAEGVELCLIMLREGKFSKGRALRVLDHAMSGSTGSAVCEKLVEAAGLKTIFATFIKSSDHTTTEHVLGIFGAMLRRLPGDSAPRIRTLAKFMEKNYEKLGKLTKLRHDYATRLRPIDLQIERERAAMSAGDAELLIDEWLSRRLDAGLFCLQTTDLILAWLVAEDEGAGKYISAALGDRDESLADLRRTLMEQLNGLEATKGKEEMVEAEMLRTLVDFLH